MDIHIHGKPKRNNWFIFCAVNQVAIRIRKVILSIYFLIYINICLKWVQVSKRTQDKCDSYAVVVLGKINMLYMIEIPKLPLRFLQTLQNKTHSSAVQMFLSLHVTASWQDAGRAPKFWAVEIFR